MARAGHGAVVVLFVAALGCGSGMTRSPVVEVVGVADAAPATTRAPSPDASTTWGVRFDGLYQTEPEPVDGASAPPRLPAGRTRMYFRFEAEGRACHVTSTGTAADLREWFRCPPVEQASTSPWGSGAIVTRGAGELFVET